MKKIIDINLYAYGNGSHNFNCEQGPTALKKAIEAVDFSTQYHWNPILQAHNHHQQKEALNDIVTLSKKLAQATQQSVLQNHFFITLGGDHTAAIGSWSGAATAVNADLGLIWFDAHMDSHTFETTPSNNIHGMPLAVLLGHGDTQLTEIASKTPKFKPENVVLIGVRSYESGEAQLLKQLGVTVFYMNDINKIGLRAVIQKSIATVTENTAGFGISIDLDGFDPIDAPGVGSPAPNGIRADDFLAAFSAITQHPKLRGVDIVEFNPTLDIEHKTEQLCVQLFQEMVANCT